MAAFCRVASRMARPCILPPPANPPDEDTRLAAAAECLRVGGHTGFLVHPLRRTAVILAEEAVRRGRVAGPAWKSVDDK